jgi:NitT/TauT family transport system permease protein
MSAVSINSQLSSASASNEATITARARKRGRQRKLAVWGARALLAVLIIGGWQLLTDVKVVDRFFWGQPSGIVTQLRDWINHGTQYGSIWLQIWITMKEAVLGFLVGVAAGVVVGVALGQNRFLADVVQPFIKILNAIPRIVLGALFTVALGLGTDSKVLLAAVLVFFVVFFNAYQGVREVDQNLINNARVLGASKMQVTRHVTLPSSLTWIIASLHVAFGFAIIGAIVGEFLGAQKGLGLVIASSMNNFNPDGVFAAMLIIAVVALTAEGILGWLERRLLSWRPPSTIEASGI